MANETAVLSDFVVQLSYTDIPPRVVDHTKRLILNLLGAQLWGWVTEGGPITFGVLAELGGVPESTVAGSSRRLPAPAAAGANAALAFASKADDTHGDAFVHPGHVIIPAVFATGEVTAASGTEVLSAIVAATEAGLRVSRAVAPGQDRVNNSTSLGFWSEVKGAILAALAAGRMHRLDAHQLAHAIGIAATSSSGLLSSAGYGPPPHRSPAGSVYAWDAGKAAMLGVLAARLAAAGMTAGERPLEGERGWVRTYTGGHGRMADLTDGLGERFDTLGITYKVRAMSHIVFASVEAVGSIVREQRLAPGDIDEIVVHGPEHIGQNFWRTNINSFEDAASSAPFAIAVNAVDPSPFTLPDAVIAGLTDPSVRRLVDRCRFEVDPTAQLSGAALPGNVVVRCCDGREFHRRQPAREHVDELPVGEDGLEFKLRRAASMRLAAGADERIATAVRTMEELPDVGLLTRHLRAERDDVPVPDES